MTVVTQNTLSACSLVEVIAVIEKLPVASCIIKLCMRNNGKEMMKPSLP